jgi:hypothetical protein
MTVGELPLMGAAEAIIANGDGDVLNVSFHKEEAVEYGNYREIELALAPTTMRVNPHVEGVSFTEITAWTIFFRISNDQDWRHVAFVLHETTLEDRLDAASELLKPVYDVLIRD